MNRHDKIGAMATEERDRLLAALGRELRRMIAGTILFNTAVAEKVGISNTEMQCMHLLQLQGEATPGEIARWSGLTTGGVTVMLDRMEKAGYVKRFPNPADRRSSLVRPVLSRFKKFERIYREKQEGMDQVFAAYTDDQLRLILDFFERTVAQAGDLQPRPEHFAAPAQRKK